MDRRHRDVGFQPRKIGLRDLQIDGLREQQRDVDADAFPDQLLDRGQALRRRRHLDHQILAMDLLPQSLGFGDGTLGIQRQIWRHFEADKPVLAVMAVIDRTQHIGGVLDILDREALEQVGDRQVALVQGLADRGVIFVRTADRLLEDRRVGGDALDAIGLDQGFQVAPGDKAAGQKVQPDRLTMCFECFDRVHHACFLFVQVPDQGAAAVPGMLRFVNTCEFNGSVLSSFVRQGSTKI